MSDQNGIGDLTNVGPLSNYGSVLGGPAPADLANYRVQQEAAEKAHEARYAAERAREEARQKDDRDIQRRAAALEAAIRTQASACGPADIVAAARQFEAFLGGQSESAQ